MKTRIKELPMVRVEAVDWSFRTDTYELNDKGFTCIDCIIVGFLVEEDQEKISIAYEGFEREWKNFDDVRKITTIPKVNVIKIEYLEIKK